jgi:hypothetical protein
MTFDGFVRSRADLSRFQLPYFLLALFSLAAASTTLTMHPNSNNAPAQAGLVDEYLNNPATAITNMIVVIVMRASAMNMLNNSAATSWIIFIIAPILRELEW